MVTRGERKVWIFSSPPPEKEETPCKCAGATAPSAQEIGYETLTKSKEIFTWQVGILSARARACHSTRQELPLSPFAYFFQCWRNTNIIFWDAKWNFWVVLRPSIDLSPHTVHEWRESVIHEEVATCGRPGAGCVLVGPPCAGSEATGMTIMVTNVWAKVGGGDLSKSTCPSQRAQKPTCPKVNVPKSQPVHKREKDQSGQIWGHFSQPQSSYFYLLGRPKTQPDRE